MNPKVVLVLVIVLGLLVVAAVTLGAVGGVGDYQAGDVGERLRLDGDPLLAGAVWASDGSSNCKTSSESTAIRVGAGRTCDVVVSGDSGSFVRTAPVRLQSGASVTVTRSDVGDGKRQVSLSFDLEPNVTRRLQFFKEGGQLSFSCPGSEACVVLFPYTPGT